MDIHYILHDFELWLDGTSDFGLAALERLKNVRLHFFSFAFKTSKLQKHS